MKPRRIEVSHSRREGFTLSVEEYSRFRSGIVRVADFLCILTGHRFCDKIVNPPSIWDEKGSTELVRVPIDREKADKLAYRKDSWTWLDED